MKLWERVEETSLRREVSICEKQYDFMPKKEHYEIWFDFILFYMDR